MARFGSHDRDRGLRRVSSVTKWLVAGSVAAVGVVTGVVAAAAPGSSRSTTPSNSGDLGNPRLGECGDRLRRRRRRNPASSTRDPTSPRRRPTTTASSRRPIRRSASTAVPSRTREARDDRPLGFGAGRRGLPRAGNDRRAGRHERGAPRRRPRGARARPRRRRRRVQSLPRRLRADARERAPRARRWLPAPCCSTRSTSRCAPRG